MDIVIEEVISPLKAPFVITGYSFTDLHAIWVSLSDKGVTGRGEGVGMYYLGETPESMRKQLLDIKEHIHPRFTRDELQEILPPGGARNALDCALWDWESKALGASVWERVGLRPRPLVTVATVGLGSIEEMVGNAANYEGFPILKIKLNNEEPIQKLEAIRARRPEADLVVDVNEGWTLEELRDYMPHLSRLKIAMVEQPLPRNEDVELEGFPRTIPIGADESCRDLSEVDRVASLYDVVNVKLDKCGGLTEALKIVDRAQSLNLHLMVGNMTGTSLSMAPSHVIGQSCQFVDIDGPLLLAQDIDNGLIYRDGGLVDAPSPKLWG